MARPRDHAGADDLPALLDFASRSLTARFPVDAGWRPGDLAGVRFRRDLDSESSAPDRRAGCVCAMASGSTLEGLRRLKARGLRHARVSMAHFNAPAIATYRSAGFEVVDRMAWWERSPT